MTDLTTLHEELTGVVLVGRSMTAVLTDLTGVARRAMPGAEAVSITLIRNDHPFTAAHDGQIALDADELQYERDYGPCVDAGRSGQVFLIDAMRTDDRWPDYTRHAAGHGVAARCRSRCRSRRRRSARSTTTRADRTPSATRTSSSRRRSRPGSRTP
jgi:hypothetical protein